MRRAAALAVLAALAGCGGSTREEDRERRTDRLDPALQRQLPRTQYVLGEQLCPRFNGIEDPIEAAALEERAIRQRDALARALEQAPDARVPTVRPDVDGTGIRRQRITVRALAETHLAGLAPVEGVRDNGCAGRERERLRRRLEAART